MTRCFLPTTDASSLLQYDRTFVGTGPDGDQSTESATMSGDKLAGVNQPARDVPDRNICMSDNELVAASELLAKHESNGNELSASPRPDDGIRSTA